MDSWKEHEVTFASAEGLSNNETSVRVLQKKLSKKEIREIKERTDEARERAEGINGHKDNVSAAVHMTELSERIRNDAGYKFLMMVAAFSRRDIRKLTSIPTNKRGRGACSDADTCTSVSSCLYAPEVTGIVQMSASVYGHVKEAEHIVCNYGMVHPLKVYIESPLYAPLFARLVSIRMALSDCMSSTIQTFDGNFKRLHQEQSMLLRALRNVRPRGPTRDWTRPL